VSDDGPYCFYDGVPFTKSEWREKLLRDRIELLRAALQDIAHGASYPSDELAYKAELALEKDR